MSGRIRGGVLLANVLLLLGIAWVGLKVFLGSAPDKTYLPPLDFDPTRHAISSEGVKRSTVDQYAVVWMQLDPSPPPPAPTQVAVQPTIRTPQDLASLYELVAVHYDPDYPEGASFIVRTGGQSLRPLKRGDLLDNKYRVIDIIVEGAGDTTEAIVTIDDNGTPNKIRLAGKQTP